MMDDYRILGQIGEGAHGLIFRGTGVQTNKQVALKKIFVKKLEQGIPKQILREIKSMQVIESKYVMRLLDFFAQGVSVVLVFDFMPWTLSEVITERPEVLTEPTVKAYTQMILKGLSVIHSLNIMHRDLKPGNLLISWEGILKIGDFGLARLKWEKGGTYTHQVATRWYRAPELLYGARLYTEAVDLWAVGCILAEMYSKTPVFPGETDIDQLALVVACLGSPVERNWPGVSRLPDYNKISFPDVEAMPLEKLVPDLPPLALELTDSFIKYDPASRAPANKALMHPFFSQHPYMCKESQLPKPEPTLDQQEDGGVQPETEIYYVDQQDYPFSAGTN